MKPDTRRRPVIFFQIDDTPIIWKWKSFAAEMGITIRDLTIMAILHTTKHIERHDTDQENLND